MANSDGFTTNIIKIQLLVHIRNRIKRLEASTNGIVALQFADHPEGLAMTVRIFTPASGKEYSYPDVILPFELVERDAECSRIDVLFDAIHEALESVQPVSSTSGGLIHH